MSPERWRRVKELFDQVAAQPPEDRRAALEASGEPDGIRAEVLRLLEADQRARAALDDTVGEVFAAVYRPPERPTRPSADRLGPYRLVEEIGRGGMAVVYAAVRDDDQFRREVAIKLIRRGMDSASLVARFRQERQILANLDHPNIARLYDGGVNEDGVPYLVMERIEGEPIDQYCEARNLPIEARLDLVLAVCGAVQLAHQNLVVHRDLKPSNIVVGTDGVPKLLDFGIAKLLEPDDLEIRATPTVEGARPMTPGYASPEQVLGQPITTASDVYALGVLLYRLLAGQPPYRVDGRPPVEIQRLVCEADPPPPSVAAAHGEAAAASPDARHARALARRLRGDLDTIVAKAMRKRPEHRYVSAAALADDLERHLAGLPISARAASAAYRLRKFVRRHGLGVAAAATVALSLIGGIVATTWQARIAREQRRAAIAERETSGWTLDFLVDLFEVSHPDRALGDTVTARQLLDVGAERVEQGEAPAGARASLLDAVGTAYLNLGLYAQAKPLLEDALAEDERSPGDLLRRAQILHHLGRLDALTERRPERAAQRLGEAGRLLRGIAAPDQQVAAVENDLLPVMIGLGQIATVEPRLRDALAWQEARLGPRHPEVALAANNLALLLRHLERWGEAEERYRQALDIARSSRGSEHLSVAVPLSNLGVVLRAQGRTDEAIEAFEQARALELRYLPESHPSPWVTQSNLALCFVNRDRAKATALLEESLDHLRRTLDEDRHEVATALTNLAGIYMRDGELDRARPAYEDALRRYVAASGPDHLDVASVRNNLGVALIRLGDFASAEHELEAARQVNERLLGPRSAAVGRNLNNLATLSLARDDVPAAVVFFRRALDARLAARGEAHAEVAESRKNLGEALLEIGEAEEAMALLEAARRGYEGAGNEVQVQITRVGLARAALALGRAEECEGHARAALAVWERMPRGGLGAAITASVLGACECAQGRTEHAIARLAAAAAQVRADARAGAREKAATEARLAACRAQVP